MLKSFAWIFMRDIRCWCACVFVYSSGYMREDKNANSFWENFSNGRPWNLQSEIHFSIFSLSYNRKLETTNNQTDIDLSGVHLVSGPKFTKGAIRILGHLSSVKIEECVLVPHFLSHKFGDFFCYSIRISMTGGRGRVLDGGKIKYLSVYPLPHVCFRDWISKITHSYERHLFKIKM